MEAIDNLLQQLRLIVPAFDTSLIPRDSTGAYASSVHLIAGLLGVNPTYVKRQLDCRKIIANINENCTLTKLVGVRNRLLAGKAESLVRVLASCNRPEIRSIVAKLPLVLSVAPGPQAPLVASGPQVLSVAPGPQASSVEEDDDDMVTEDQFDFEPTQMVDFVLKLADGSDFVVPVRRDGYVNVTKICQAAGKRLQHYKESPAGKEYIEFLKNRKFVKSNSRNPAITLLTSMRGNCPGRGTYAHPDLAMAIAMWAHPPFLADVSGWIRELLVTGRVDLGKEKSVPELKQKLEETFQAVDEDTKAFLREKRSRELLAIDEDQASKRRREDAAIEDEKKDRAAKRQRDDAAADKKTKDEDAKNAEESRMKMVLFDAEMSLRRIDCAKNLIDLRAIFVPKLTACLEQSLVTNAHLRSAINDIEVNLVRKISKCITGDDDNNEGSGYQETLYCHDFQTFLREMGRPVATTSELSKLGKFIATNYRKRFGKDPDLVEKYINGDNRPVKTYKIEYKGFIEKSIKEFYDQLTAQATENALVASPSKLPKDMRSFFGPLNMSQMHINISCEK